MYGTGAIRLPYFCRLCEPFRFFVLPLGRLPATGSPRYPFLVSPLPLPFFVRCRLRWLKCTRLNMRENVRAGHTFPAKSRPAHLYASGSALVRRHRARSSASSAFARACQEYHRYPVPRNPNYPNTCRTSRDHSLAFERLLDRFVSRERLGKVSPLAHPRSILCTLRWQSFV